MKGIRNTYAITLLVGWCLILLAGISRGEPAAADTAAITSAAGDFHKELSKGKPDHVIGLLAPDALIVEGGTVQTRDEYQREHLAEDIAYARAVPSTRRSIVVRQEGDVAWVTITFSVTGSFEEKPVDSLAAETMVLTKTAAGWRIRTVHWSSQQVRAGEGR